MHMTLKMLSISLISVSFLAISPAFAASKKTQTEDQNIDVSQDQASLEEIATVYNLSKLCPSLVKDKATFEKAYDVELKKVLPNESNPKTFVQTLAKQKDFQLKLKDVQKASSKFSKKENAEMCQEVADYRY